MSWTGDGKFDNDDGGHDEGGDDDDGDGGDNGNDDDDDGGNDDDNEDFEGKDSRMMIDDGHFVECTDCTDIRRMRTWQWWDDHPSPNSWPAWMVMMMIMMMSDDDGDDDDDDGDVDGNYEFWIIINRPWPGLDMALKNNCLPLKQCSVTNN